MFSLETVVWTKESLRNKEGIVNIPSFHVLDALNNNSGGGDTNNCVKNITCLDLLER
jgi:hypothetical protein